MLDRALGAAVLVALVAASAAVYRRRHRGVEAQDARDAIASPREFRHVAVWVHGSTLIAGSGALLLEHPVFLAVPTGPIGLAVGLAVALLGLWMFVVAMRILGRDYSPCYDARLPRGVVRSGPYARIRHPVYTANLLQLAGLTVATGSAWLLANLVLLGAYYGASARREEDALAARFPEYAGYLEESGRFLPRLRARGAR